MTDSKEFALTNISSFGEKTVREHRLQNRGTFLKALDWNHYEKIRVVGKGAFGTAVLYRKKPDGMRLVVLKEINMNDLNASERQSAINEVKVLSILNHPNIISYYDSFECEGDLYIEMEYADAGTLSQFLSRLAAPLSEYEILLIFIQIVCAISYLHEKNILHRDIKTDNIFLNKEGYIKLGDFGISKILNTRREAESVVGTPYYISPEICEGKNYDKKSDVWALGCVLYEMACLHKTFEGSNLPALINKIVKGHFEPIKQNYSNDFRKLIQQLLQRNPDLRPTAHKVMESVSRIQNKLQLDRIQMWSQNQEMPTSVITSGYLNQNNRSNDSSMRYPRSIVYEVQTHKPHIKLTPIRLPPKLRIKEISKSSTHILALSYDSSIYCWGSATDGQLGLGQSIRTNISEPKLIESLRNRNIIHVCAGNGFSVFVSKNGMVMTCGDYRTGCLGRTESVSCFTPKLVDVLLATDVSYVSCGSAHVSVVTGDGRAYSWGHNTDGRLGVDSNDILVESPTSVVFPEGVIIKNVFCGHDCTAFVDENGSVWMCGNNESNKLGLNERTNFRTIKVSHQSIPTKLRWIKHKVHSVCLGRTHSAFVIEGGKMITTGSNCDAQLGLANVRPNDRPAFVLQLAEQSIIRVQTGSCFTMALNSQNVIYFWGTRHLNPISSEENENQNNNHLFDAIKLGECNQSLMNVIECVGPDHPIVQIRDPQIIIDNLSDLSLLSSPNRAVILKAQPIISLYASPAHLHQRDLVGLSNIYVFSDDSIYIVIDTTLPLNGDNSQPNQQTLNVLSVAEEGLALKGMTASDHSGSNLSENIPEWIQREIEDNNSFIELKKGDSLPLVFDNQSVNCECRLQLNQLRDELQQKNNTIGLLQSQLKDLNQQNMRLRKIEEENSKRISLRTHCSHCTQFCSIQ